MSNKEKRAKRAKVKAKKNRLLKSAKRQVEVNERRSYFSERTPETYKPQKASPFSPETSTSSFFSAELEKNKVARFSSFNNEYNTLYGTLEELQAEALGINDVLEGRFEILSIDEESIGKVFARINEFVSDKKLTNDLIKSGRTLFSYIFKLNRGHVI